MHESVSLVLPGKRASKWYKKHQQAPVLLLRHPSRLPSSLPPTSIPRLITSPTSSPTLAPMFQWVPLDLMVLDGSIWDTGPSLNYYLTIHVTVSICSSALSTRALVLPSPCPRLWGQGEWTSQTLLGYTGPATLTSQWARSEGPVLCAKWARHTGKRERKCWVR